MNKFYSVVLALVLPFLAQSQYAPLAANPGFENAATISNWALTGSGTFTRTTTSRRSGTNCGRIAGLSTAYSTLHNTSFGVTVPATGTNFITVVAWVRAGGNSVIAGVGLGTAADANGPNVPAGTTATVGTTYTRVSYTVAATNGETYHPVLYAQSNGNTTVYWDDVMVYTSTQAAFDAAAPAAPSAFTISAIGNNVTFNFTQGADAGANQSGIDGVVIVRNTQTTLPTANVTLSPQVFYNTNTAIGPVTPTTNYTVVYSGAPIGSFTDAVTTNAVYLVYMRDKAFNYTANSAAARLFVVNNSAVNNFSAPINAANVSVDGIFVSANDTLRIAGSTLTLRTGANCQIDGAIRANGVLNSGGANRITFKNGSTMVHNLATTSSIVVANWQPTSLCTVTGTTNAVPTGLNQTFGHFTWNNANQTVAVNLPTTFACNGDFMVLNSGTSQLNFPAGLSYNFPANMVLNDDVGFSATGTYRFNGSGIQTLSGSLATVPDFGNMVVANTGGGLTLNRSVASSSSFTINSGAILNGGNTGATITLSGNANFTNNGSFLPGSSKVVFNGNAGRRISGTSASNFYQLVVNNAAVPALANKFVSLDADVTVSNLLVLQSGGIRTNNRLLTLASGALLTASESLTTVADETAFINSNNTSFIALCTDADAPATAGGFKRLGIGTGGRTNMVAFAVGFANPVSSTETNFTPVGILQNGAAENYTVRSITPDSPPGTYSGSCVDYSYNISEDVAGGSNCTLRLYWQDYMEGGVFLRHASAIVHSNGTSVDYYSPSVGSAAIATGNVQLWAKEGTGFTSFSPFAVTSNSNLLPVLFNYVQASVVNGGQALVQWQVSADADVAYYVVEKSENGVGFKALATIESKNATVSMAYSYTDISLKNTGAVYRIVAVEKNGKQTLSKQLWVAGTNRATGFAVAPNPVVGHSLQLQLSQLPKGNYVLKLVGANGQLVQQTSLQYQGGSSSIVVALAAAMPAGSYRCILSGNGLLLNQAIVVQ